MTTNWSCDGNLSRPSCQLSPTEYGEMDSVAAIRIIISCLSLMGTATIIFSTLCRREIFNHKVHPIFVLSIADAMLSLVYIVAGSLWLRMENSVYSRVWCFAASLPTVMLQCVTVNLTVVYALLAYAGVRQRHSGNLLRDDDADERVWSPRRTIISYLVAWLLPVVMVMVLFAAVVADTGLLHSVDNCSCWCRPSLGNLIPYAKGRDDETIEFRRNIRKLVVTFAAVVSTHFLAGFIILIVIYRLMIRTIRAMRETARRQSTAANYGAVGHALTEPALQRAEFLAKRRVIYFLLVFMVSGCFNLLLCVELMVFDVKRLIVGEKMSPSVEEANKQSWVQVVYYVTLCLQSVTITQQGFLNAIVYGWTREDFLDIMAIGGQKEVSTQLVSDVASSESEEEKAVAEERTPKRKRNRISREQSFEYNTDSDYEVIETSVHN